MKITDYRRSTLGLVLGTVSDSSAIGGVSSSSNAPAGAGMTIVAISSNMFEWRDALSFGSNTNDVSSLGTMGSSPSNTRADHVHRGVHQLTAAGSNALYGDVNLVAGTGMAITAGGNTLTFASTAVAGGTVTGITANSSNSLSGAVNLQAGSGIALGVAASTITVTNIAQGGGAGAAGSGLVLLEQHTASASATLDFTTFISSTYDDYLFRCVNLMPTTTNTNLLMQMGTGAGPTYDTGANYGWAGWRWAPGGSAFAGASSGPTSIGLDASGGVKSDAVLPFSGSWRLSGPQSTASAKTVIGQAGYVDNTGTIIGCTLTGLYIPTTAVTAVRFLMSSGNITSGTIRVYGVAKT